MMPKKCVCDDCNTAYITGHDQWKRNGCPGCGSHMIRKYKLGERTPEIRLTRIEKEFNIRAADLRVLLTLIRSKRPMAARELSKILAMEVNKVHERLRQLTTLKLVSVELTNVGQHSRQREMIKLYTPNYEGERYKTVVIPSVELWVTKHKRADRKIAHCAARKQMLDTWRKNTAYTAQSVTKSSKASSDVVVENPALNHKCCHT